MLNTYTGQLRHFRINSISEINISSLHKWKKCLKPILCTVWSGLHTRKYSISSMISCFHLAVRHFIIVVWDISWLDEWLKYVDLVHESQEVFFEMCSWSNLKQEKYLPEKSVFFTSYALKEMHQICYNGVHLEVLCVTFAIWLLWQGTFFLQFSKISFSNELWLTIFTNCRYF